MKQLIQPNSYNLQNTGAFTTNQPSGELAMIFYYSRADIGIGKKWVPLVLSLPKNLKEVYYLETTPRGNGILLFRSSRTSQHYELLASHQGREVLAKYGENTFLAQAMLDRLQNAGVNVHELRTLTEQEEDLLLASIPLTLG
jgi:hypothetical protein